MFRVILSFISVASAQNLQLAIDQKAVDLLKDQFLPMIFGKIQDISIPPVGVDNKWFGVNLTDTKVSIPISASDFNNDWQIKLLANGSEPVVRITSEKLPLVISSAWAMHFSILKSSGHIEADFVEVGFSMDIQLSSLLNAQQELGPFVLIQNTNFGFDKSKSNIKVTGKGVAAWTIKIVEDIFQRELFNILIKEVQKVLSTTL